MEEEILMRLEQLEKKVADLEKNNQSQPTVEDVIEKLAEMLQNANITLS